MPASYTGIFLAHHTILPSVACMGEGLRDEDQKTSAREATIMFMYWPHMDLS